MRCALNVLLVSGIFITTGTSAQTPPPAAGTVPSVHLLRLERFGYLQSVCVLLRGNGEYHLERHRPREVRVFESKIGADEFERVVQILSGDTLFNLQQEQIPDLMMKADADKILLAIHRPSDWQQLTFPDSASRQPFRDAMDPLLKWFDSLNNRKMHELSEEAGRNNCYPPRKPEFAERAEALPQIPPAKDPPPVSIPLLSPSYVLQMFDNRALKYQTHASCLLVSVSGSYHLVRQIKDDDKGMSIAVLDGTLSPPALASLRAVLDAPALVEQPEEAKSLEVVFVVDSYYTRLSIPRDGKVQKISAWKAYGIVDHVLTRTVEDHGTALLVPLRNWLKDNIPEQDAASTINPPNPRCDPDR